MGKREDLIDLKGAGGGESSPEPVRTPDSLYSQDYFEILLALSEGPIKGIVQDPALPDGNLVNFFAGDTPATNAAGTANFSDFSATFYQGYEDDPEFDLQLGGQSANLQVGVRLSQNTTVTRQTPVSARGVTNQLEFRIYFTQLVDVRDTGTYQAYAHFNISYKPSLSSVWINYNNEATTTIYGKTTTGAVKDFIIPVELINDDYDVRVTKFDGDSTGTGNGTSVDITWESLQMVHKGKVHFDDLALVHIYGKVSNQFNSIPVFSGIYEGLIVQVPTNYNSTTKTYDETTPWLGGTKPAYTNNPAWILYALCTNPRYGLPRYYLTVSANIQEFYEAAKWCDELVSDNAGGMQPRFQFNMQITEGQPGLQLLAYIAGSFNAIIYDDGNGILTLKTDQPRGPRQIFSPENVTEDGFNYNFTDISTRYNDITVAFINPDLDWTEDRRSATIDNTADIAANGRIPFDFIAIGCTDAHEAIRRANYRYVTANKEVTTVSFATSRYALSTALFDTIYIADPEAAWSMSGRVKSIAGSVIQLRDPIYFPDTTIRQMLVQTFDGIVSVNFQPPAVGAVYSLNLVNSNFPTNVPDRTVFTIQDAIEIGFAKPFKILAIEESEGSPDKYLVTALEVYVNKYPDSDLGAFSTPVKYSYVTPGEPKLPPELRVESVAPIIGSDGSLTYRLLASWDKPVDANTAYYEVDYMELETATWITVRSYGIDAYLTPVKNGTSYSVRLYAVSPLGRRSEKCLSVNSFTATGKVASLPNVSGLAVYRTNTGWQARWDDPSSYLPDWASTGVKLTTPSQQWEALSLNFKAKTTTQPFSWRPAGITRIQAKHYDTSGNESAQASFYDLSVEAPGATTITVETTIGPTTVYITDTERTQPLLYVEVKIGADTSTYENANLLQTRLGATQRVFTVVPSSTGPLKLYVRAYDVANNGGTVAAAEIPPSTASVEELYNILRGNIDETWLSPDYIAAVNDNIADQVFAEAEERLHGDGQIQTQVDNLSVQQGNLSTTVSNLSIAFTDGQTSQAATVTRLIAQRAGYVLNSDPWITSLLNWTSDVPSAITQVVPPLGESSRFVLHNTSANNVSRNTPRIPIDFTRTYRVSCKARRNPNVVSGVFFLVLSVFDTNGAELLNLRPDSYWFYQRDMILTGSITAFSANVGPEYLAFPSNAATMQVAVLQGYTGNSSYPWTNGSSWSEAWDIRLEDITVEASLGSQITTVNQAVTNQSNTFAQSIATVKSSIITRPNLVKNGGFELGKLYWGGGQLFKFTVNTSTSLWGTSLTATASANAVANGTDGLYTELFPVQGGEWYVVHGDALLFAASGGCYFDMLYYDASGIFIATDLNGDGFADGDGGQNYKPATFDFSANDTNRAYFAVESRAPGNAVSALVRFIWQDVVSVTAIGIRLVKAERGRLPYTAYSSETAATEQYALVQTEASTRATTDGYLGAQYAIRASLTSGGVTAIAGIGISGTAAPGASPTFDMTFRADKFAWMGPAGQSDAVSYPLIYYPSAQTLPNGIIVQPGLYLKNLYVEYVNADRIDARGLALKDLAGNTILAAGTSLSKAYIGAGLNSNQIRDSEFVDRKVSSWAQVNNPYGAVIDFFGTEQARVAAPTSIWVPLGTDGLVVHQSGRAGSGVSGGPTDYGIDILYIYPLAVVGGGKVEFSCYVSGHRCPWEIYIDWRDASNNNVGYSESGVTYGVNQNGQNLAGFVRSQILANAPATAISANLVVRKYNTDFGQGDSYLWVLKPFFSLAGANQTQISDYSPGPSAYGTTNSAISISPNGTLIGAGGGQVTLPALGAGSLAFVNQINSLNVSSYFSAAAFDIAYINRASIASLSALSATIGLLRTATSGARTEISDNVIKIFDSSNLKRVQIGDLNL